MKSISIFMYQTGKGLAPNDWKQIPNINIQRLYHIKGGTGGMVFPDGSVRPFLNNSVYLIPSNFKQNFITVPDDPIDHVYFDFFTSPPIVSPEPIVYPIEPGSALEAQLTAVERVIRPRNRPRPAHFGQISDAISGGDGEYCQLCCNLLHTLLLMLSQQGELPFTDDRVVTDTLDYIRDNYASPISIERLAARSGFETNYFIRRFKRVLGVTPYSFLRAWRLQRARELISHGMTVAAASESVGYENPSSLSRALAGERD